VAVRDWGRVEERLRARADGMRRIGPHSTGSLAVGLNAEPRVLSAEPRCADCAASISVARLRAAPSAMRCVACQRAWETA
jgi:hypothetical protein